VRGGLQGLRRAPRSPQILDDLAAIKSFGLKLTISTSGVPPNEERERALVDLGIDGVTDSLDSTTE
jgi:MoaA/NifB/PqqE/SkfB family radical SAM enzyme